MSYIWRNAGRLAHDPWETVGFELLFPMLLDQAQAQNLPLPYAAFDGVMRLRAEKLARAPLHLAYDTYDAAGNQSGSAGRQFDLRRAGRVQQPTGGVAVSPSATAFLLRHQPGDRAARGYVQRALYGTGPMGAPDLLAAGNLGKELGLVQFQHACPTCTRSWPT